MRLVESREGSIEETGEKAENEERVEQKEERNEREMIRRWNWQRQTRRLEDTQRNAEMRRKSLEKGFEMVGLGSVSCRQRVRGVAECSGVDTSGGRQEVSTDRYLIAF